MRNSQQGYRDEFRSSIDPYLIPHAVRCKMYVQTTHFAHFVLTSVLSAALAASIHSSRLYPLISVKW